MRAKKRLLSLLLCCAMLFSLCPQVVSAEGVQDSGKTIGGLCEHHPAHDESCGYTEGIPGTPCNHEHTEDCYTLAEKCVHEHTDECYPAESVSDDTATPSDATEPTECAHKCSEESGCIKKELDCQHEHTEDCGYVPATEGTPCGFVCEECNPVDSGTNPAYPAEKPETECICKTLCTEEERNADCLVCGAEGADLTLCKGVEPETDTPSNAAQLSVGDVQKLIDELPTADELAAMTPEEQQAVYTKVQAAYEAYNALTDEQKAEVTGAEIFEELFAAFNSMVNALEENTGGFTVTGGMYGVDYTYNEADGKLYILTSTKLTITTNGKATSSMIWGTRNITYNLVFSNLHMNGTQNDSHVNLFGHVNLTIFGTNEIDVTGIGFSAGSLTITSDSTGSLNIAGMNSTQALWIDGTGSNNKNLEVNGGSLTYNTAEIGGTTSTSDTGTINGQQYQHSYTVSVNTNSTEGTVIGGGKCKADQSTTVTAIPNDGYHFIEWQENGQKIDNAPASYAFTVKGKRTLTAVFQQHTFGDWNSNGDSTHTRTCTYTDCTNKEQKEECNRSGTDGTCSECGYQWIAITSQPTGATVNAGDTAMFTVEATGRNISYQWQVDKGRGWENVAGATSKSYTTPATTMSMNGWQYQVVTSNSKSNGKDSQTSATVLLTVNTIQLSQPTNLHWGSDAPGKAQAVWDAVENADGYSVQLYKDGDTEVMSVSVEGTEYNFNITEAGTYFFKVTAIGTGNYSNSVDAGSGDLTFYTVSFNTNGGSNIDEQVVAQDGKAAKPPAPTKTGYTFGGWYSDSGLNTPYDFDSDTISDTTTLYAKWTAIIYNVAVTVEGGTDNTASASPASATIETQVTLTATPAEGYHFVEWQVVSGGITISKQNTFTMPAGNVEVKAVFAEHQFSNWKANGNDTHIGTCSCGETKTEACSYIDGTCSVCGYVDVAITTHPESITVKEGQPAAFAVAAKGDDISYQWQIKAGNNDWADISEATASSYTTNAATMEMNGYQYRCTVSNGKGDSATSDAAKLTVQKTTSEMEPEFIGYFVEHYKKNPVSGKYEQADREYRVDGINQTVTATPKEYTGYTCNPDAAGTVTSGTLKEIKGEEDIVVLKLYYDPDTYDVTLNGNGGKIADGKNVTSYTYGVGAALPAAEDMTRSGYAFKGWYEDSSFSSDPVTEISTTATGDKTYYAKWAKLWTVTVKAESGGSVSGSGTFEENTEITVTATPNGGYHFVRWTENGAEVSTNANYTFTLIADRTLTAVFSRNSSGGGGGGGSSTTYYTLTFDTNGGSKIDTFRTSSYGLTVDLSGYTPTRKGYDFNGWYSDADLTNRITEIRLNGNKTVYAGWTKHNPGTGVDNPFTDVHENDWFYNHVMFVYQNGLMNGTSATTFSPNSSTTRAQIATIFYRMAGSPAVENANTFTDVPYGPGTDWYYDAVLWVQQNGIMQGYGNNLFGPNDPVTREQLAMIFYNYAKFKGYDTTANGDLSGFTDAGDLSPWAQEAMKWAVGSGVMSGKGNGILDPKGTATRAEIAAMLQNFIEKNNLVPVVPGGNGGTGGTGSGGGGWTQHVVSPQTGDSSNIGLWFSTMLLSLAAIVALTVIRRREQKEEESLPQLV